MKLKEIDVADYPKFLEAYNNMCDIFCTEDKTLWKMLHNVIAQTIGAAIQAHVDTIEQVNNKLSCNLESYTKDELKHYFQSGIVE